jgi:hypothetical protein
MTVRVAVVTLLPRLHKAGHFHREKAGNGNRTRMASLEGWNFTIKLCPRDEELNSENFRE